MVASFDKRINPLKIILGRPKFEGLGSVFVFNSSRPGLWRQILDEAQLLNVNSHLPLPWAAEINPINKTWHCSGASVSTVPNLWIQPTMDRLYYMILFNGLAHLRSLVSARGPGTNAPQIPRDDLLKKSWEKEG